MAGEDSKDRVREQIQSFVARIQETSAWQKLMEKYQDLSPTMQKLALGMVGVVFALLLLALPWSFFSSSQSTLEDFEGKKTLIRDLYRYSHLASTLPQSPIPMTPSEMRSMVQNILSTEPPPVIPAQILDTAEIDNVTAKSPSLPSSLTQKGLLVKLSKLNLTQIVKFGAKLQSLRSTAKIVGLKIQSTLDDPHYFDVSFKLIAFNLPAEPPPKTAPGSKPGAGSKPSGK